jgi:V-type H+-transporting ATPase subunit d
MASFSLGGLSTFNMQHGFVEALVRGFRSGFLLDDAYHHLSQCETLEVGLLFSLYD